MSASNFTETNFVRHLLKIAAWTQAANIYVSLHTGDPGETGSNEQSGNAYARVQHNDWAESGGVGDNTGTVTWPTASGDYAAPLTHFGLWDADAGGNFLAGGALDDNKSIGDGDTPEAADGSLTVTAT